MRKSISCDHRSRVPLLGLHHRSGQRPPPLAGILDSEGYFVDVPAFQRCQPEEGLDWQEEQVA